jgi:hypothetical protein
MRSYLKTYCEISTDIKEFSVISDVNQTYY